MRLLSLVCICSMIICAGCASGEKKATELLDTAGFEEKQNNFEHAGKLYDEIIKKYPESKAAKDAAARLAVLKNRKP